jgi:hypothetical protein
MRLCNRLPLSLHTLIFHLSDDDMEPALSQMSHLVQMRPDVLPNLQQICVGTDDEYYIHEFDQMLVESKTRVSAGPHPLKVSVGGGRLATVFDAIPPSQFLPDTKWFGDKYSARWRMPNNMDRALDKMGLAYEEGRRGQSITDVLADDPELQAIFRHGAPVIREPIEYYDSDDDVPEKDVYRLYS